MKEKVTGVKKAMEAAMLQYLKESSITTMPAMEIIERGVSEGMKKYLAESELNTFGQASNVIMQAIENAIAKWLDENQELVLHALARRK